MKMTLVAKIVFEGKGVDPCDSTEDEAENLKDMILDSLGYPKTIDVSVTIDSVVVEDSKVEG